MITVEVTQQKKTRCVALPSLVAARWVGQNSVPIFLPFVDQSTPIKFARVGVFVVCNAIFQVMCNKLQCRIVLNWCCVISRSSGY